jgi:hypothetical protein
MAYQRLGAPKGYLIFEFSGNAYTAQYKASGKPIEKQMSLSILSPTFTQWANTMMDWFRLNSNVSEPPLPTPPVNINDLPDTKIVTRDELLEGTYLMANVWNGSLDSKVYMQIDDRAPVLMERTQPGIGEGFINIPDPFALRLTLYSYRYAARSTSGNDRAQGFEMFRGDKFGPGDPRPLEEWLWTDQSMHLWRARIPLDLENGVHLAKVSTVDVFRYHYKETMIFEVDDERPSGFANREVFEPSP